MNIQEEKKKNKNRRKKKSKEFTFVLGAVWVFINGNVSDVVEEFTQFGLRCMSVTKKFLEAHLNKKGRNTFDYPVVDYVNSDLFIAIKLEGKLSTKQTQEFPSWHYWKLVYCSDSVQSAREDAAMWFRPDSSNWKEEKLLRKYLTFVLPDNSKFGDSMEEVLGNRKQVGFTLDYNYQLFILIRPKAFQNGEMPKVLSAIEKNCFATRGLKLVKKSEAPDSAAWSDNSSSSGETDKEEFGIACVVLHLPFLSQREGFIPIGDQWISRDLVFVSEKGESLKFIDEFFKFGLVGWMDRTDNVICCGRFESTLTGLLFENDCD